MNEHSASTSWRVDVDDIAALLERYGCSFTDAGFRRLALILAARAGEIEVPRYEPRSTPPAHQEIGLLMQSALAAADKPSISEAARRVARSMSTLGRKLSGSSVRQYYHRWKVQVDDLLRSRRPITLERPVGQALCDMAWLQEAENASAVGLFDPSGEFIPDVHAHHDWGDLKLRFLRVSMRGSVQRLGPPQPIQMMSPLRLGIEDASTAEIEVVLPDVCRLDAAGAHFQGVARRSRRISFNGCFEAASNGIALRGSMHVGDRPAVPLTFHRRL